MYSGGSRFMGGGTPSIGDKQAPEGEPGHSVVPKILIVDDDPSLRSMYSEKFQTEGFVVFSAANGKEALELVTQKEVDVVLLDVLLPGMKGTEVLEKLREDEKGKDLIVIALSNLADFEERDKIMKFGASEYLEKALYTPEKVVEVVKKHLEL